MVIKAAKTAADTVHVTAGCQDGNLTLKQAVSLRDALSTAITAEHTPPNDWVVVSGEGENMGAYSDKFHLTKAIGGGTAHPSYMTIGDTKGAQDWYLFGADRFFVMPRKLYEKWSKRPRARGVRA